MSLNDQNNISITVAFSINTSFDHLKLIKINY